MPAIPRNSSCIFTLNIYCPHVIGTKWGWAESPPFLLSLGLRPQVRRFLRFVAGINVKGC